MRSVCPILHSYSFLFSKGMMSSCAFGKFWLAALCLLFIFMIEAQCELRNFRLEIQKGGEMWIIHKAWGGRLARFDKFRCLDYRERKYSSREREGDYLFIKEHFNRLYGHAVIQGKAVELEFNKWDSLNILNSYGSLDVDLYITKPVPMHVYRPID